MQKPSMGRVVIYVSNGERNPNSIPDHKYPKYMPATVLEVRKDNKIDLHALALGGGVSATNVPYDEKKKPGTWHWPERV